MPPDTTYSLADLSRLGDVTPRTVRYYIGQGLLPSPGSGPNARYSGTHLARLRLIRRLQRDHLPLAEIRRRLEDLTDTTVLQLAEATAEPAPSPPSDSAEEYIRRLLSQRRAVVPPAPGPLPAPSMAPPPPPMPVAAAPTSAPFAVTPSAAPSPSNSPSEPDRTTWERHALSSDVEVHVRRPLDRHTSKQIDRLLRIARDLLIRDS